MNTKEVLQLLMKYFKPFFDLTKGIMILGFAIFLVEFFSGTPIDTKQKQIILIGGGIFWFIISRVFSFFND